MAKILILTIVLSVLTLMANSTLATYGRDYSSFDEDITQVVYGIGGTDDAAYYYGFEVNPTDPSVDLDGVAASGVGDFHTTDQPDYDLTNGLAQCIDKAGAQCILRTDFTNSLWRAQFNSDAEYTVETKVNILGTGTEGAHGVFGLYVGSSISEGPGSLDLRIGSTYIEKKVSTTYTTLLTDMDNTGWHVWRIERLENDNSFYIYRDGIQVVDPIAAGPRDTKNGRSFAGDYAGDAGGDWEMEYLVYDTVVPEPASLVILGLGGVMLIRRR